MPSPTDKKCIICNQIKPLEDFSVSLLKLSSLIQIEKHDSICKHCRNHAQAKSQLKMTNNSVGKLFKEKNDPQNKEDDGTAEGGRGKGNRLYIDYNAKLFSSVAQMKAAAAAKESPSSNSRKRVRPGMKK
jgi:hypothetical protein